MSRRLTEKEVKSRLESNGSNVVILGRYISSKNHTKCQCIKCGYIWSPRMGDVLRGHGCPICGQEDSITKRRKTHRRFIIEMNEKNPLVKVVGEYITDGDKIEVECKECSCRWKATPNNLLLKSSGCPKCRYKKISFKTRKPEFVFQEQLQEVHSNIICLDKYINNKTKIRFKCTKCDSVWLAYPHSVLDGGQTGCPHCKLSKGEIAVAKYLSDNDIENEEQYYVGYKGNKWFDFAVLNQDNTVVCFIEYDGVQHFRPVDFAGRGEQWAKDNFEQIQRRDSEKSEYCSLNKIPLIRIPYYENVNEVLEEKLTIIITAMKGAV